MLTPLRLLPTIAAHVLGRPLGEFIAIERDRLSPFGRALSPDEQARLYRHFSSLDLDRVRLVAGRAVQEPAFVPILRRVGMSIPSTALAEAVTLDYLIASPAPISLGTLVHEMVHSVQYRLLGVPGFAFNYIRGFLASGYESGPLEQIAMELSQKFGKGEVFNVEHEVRTGIQRI